MKRYYISPIIGDGLSPDTSWRAKIVSYGIPQVTIFPPFGADNKPIVMWCLVRAGGVDHTAVLADIDIFALPDITLDSTLGALNASQRNKLITFLQNKGIDTTGISTNTVFREVVRKVGAQLAPGFDENRFDLLEG